MNKQTLAQKYLALVYKAKSIKKIREICEEWHDKHVKKVPTETEEEQRILETHNAK